MSNYLSDKESNDLFSKLRGNDLLDLLETIENYYLEYRYRLSIPKNVTFGTEIEFEGVGYSVAKNFIKSNLDRWGIDTDDSLRSRSGEIQSPILIDEKRTWEELKKVCEYLKKQNAIMNMNAGGHIHIGTPVLGDDLEGWRIFLKLVILYEHILYRFGFGDKINGRPKLFKYAVPISKRLYDNLDDINDADEFRNMTYCFMEDRRCSVNFTNVDYYYPNTKGDNNTIEFRFPNATDEEIIWQNNINTAAKMLLSSKARVIDEDFLDYKLKTFKPDVDNKLIYNEIYLKDALEFVDLIFNNNLDKVYFLRQYLKNFQSGVEASEGILAKRFML